MSNASLAHIGRVAQSFKRQGSEHLPGLAFCLLLVLGASYISDHYGLSKILGALLLGMAFQSVSSYPELSAGIDFCAKTVLRIGVALLGVRITFNEISQMGFAPILMMAAVVTTTIVFSLGLGALLRVDRGQSIIAGAAVGICGVSAAMAVAALMPMTDRYRQQLLCTTVAITGVSTLCMIIYPGLIINWGWHAQEMGLFIGATVHDVAQVFGAGEMISEEVAQTAAYSKMLRVALLIPVVLVLGFCFKNQAVQEPASKARLYQSLPVFLVFFVGFVLLANSGVMPKPLINTLSDISRVCLWVAMAAFGAKTNLLALRDVGVKPFALVVLNTLFIAGFAWLSITAIGEFNS